MSLDYSGGRGGGGAMTLGCLATVMCSVGL